MIKCDIKKSGLRLLSIPFFISAILCVFARIAVSEPLNIKSGTYERTISGPAVLSGDIDVRIAGTGGSSPSVNSGIFAGNGNAVTGTVRSLTIETTGTDASAINTTASLIDLKGNIRLRTSGTASYGISYGGVPGGGGVRFDGETSIITTGDYAHGVFAMGSKKDYALITKGKFSISTSGKSSYGMFLHDSSSRLDSETSIVTSGAAAHGIYASASSSIQLNGPTSVLVKGEGSYALLADGLAPYSQSIISTRQSGTSAPNPQQIRIDGPIRIYGRGNQLLLDLAAGSHVNSRVLEADNGGIITLNFFAPDAQWTTGLGSTLSNAARLELDFTQGGIWNLPVTDSGNTALASPTAPLIIKDSADMTVKGSTTIRGVMNTSLNSGESASYALAQAQGSNPLDPALFSMATASNSVLYTLDSLKKETINGYETLVAAVTRKKASEALPDIGNGAGGLLPDGNGETGAPADDGGDNPFLAAILAQHVNGLSLDEITTYLEGAPALTRVLPVSSITRGLSTRIRSNSPVAAATGSGPGPRFAGAAGQNPNAASSQRDGARDIPSARNPEYNTAPCRTSPPVFRIWASPVYLRDSEHGLKTENRSTGYKAKIWGTLAGADVTVGPWTVGGGVSFGTGNAHSTGDMARTKDDIDYAGALVYGIWARDDWVFSLEGVYTRTKSDIRQSTPVMDLKAKVNVDDFSAEILAGRGFSFGELKIMPNIGLHYSRLIQRKATIKGTAEGRTHDLFENGEATQNIWNLPIGVQVSRSFSIGDVELTPMVRGRYIAALGDRTMDVRAWRSETPSISTVMEGVTTDRHTGEISAGIALTNGPAHFYVGYAYQGSKHRDSHMLTGTIGCTF